ncbi:hypothetical protein [Mycobacterium lepromatosis]|uniref:hypothetical protein n=1 Tax=Mycobacterium lepromatosis TaxID=480418 RepID=UPI0018726BAC|nr:hypothetical protein [Mycobacterium lepromatosis]
MFEASKCVVRHSSPDYGYYRQAAAKSEDHNSKNPTLAVERKILRCSYRMVRELGNIALALPLPHPRRQPPKSGGATHSRAFG